MADRMAVLKDGKISQLGTPRELYDRPANSFCGSFLGDINFFAGVIADGCAVLPFGKFPVSGVCEKASRAAIRPERIRITAADTPGAFPATIKSGSFGGDITRWICEAGGVEFQVCEAASPVRHAGDQVFLTFDRDYLLAME